MTKTTNGKKMQSDKERMNTKEAAAYIGYSESALETWRAEGSEKGPRYYKPLGKVFYFRDDLDLWLTRNSPND